MKSFRILRRGKFQRRKSIRQLVAGQISLTGARRSLSTGLAFRRRMADVETETKTLVQRQFGANAAKYATSRPHAQGASLSRLVEMVAPKAYWRAIDVATGAGHTAFAFAPHVAHVIASDLTVQMLHVA